MLQGDVADEPLLVDYDVFIRKDPLATRFRNLIDVSWDRVSSNASRKFSFNLTAAAASIKELSTTVKFSKHRQQNYLSL